MKRALVAGIAAGAVIAGAGIIVAHPTAPSLPDVEVPAVSLSNAEGMDQNAVWLDLFTQASGNNPDSISMVDAGPAVILGDPPLVVIDPQDPAQDFEGILDGVAGRMGSPLDSVKSAIGGPDAVTYLILDNPNSGS